MIDEHVHFRDPGLTEKGDIQSESNAAAAGGITTFFDMPNTKPQTTTLSALSDKLALAKKKSLVNYAFFLGATNNNTAELQNVDATAVPGIKLFMGASTGNMLVDDNDALHNIFALAASRHLPLVTHCEDSALIARNETKIKATYGLNADVSFHPIIRDEQACINSTLKAIDMAEKHSAQLMVAHVSTAKELVEIAAHSDLVKAEACIAYLTFCDEDYASLGASIKCNPAIKSQTDLMALRHALANGQIYTIATDHAPHLPEQKQGGLFEAASGMPSVQFSLTMMLQLTDEGWLSLPQVVQLMSHNPASFFGVEQRGFLRKGYKADIVIVNHLSEPHTITDNDVLSKCGWTPYAGKSTQWQVDQTICNGTTVYQHDKGVNTLCHAAQQVTFSHDNRTQI